MNAYTIIMTTKQLLAPKLLLMHEEIIQHLQLQLCYLSISHQQKEASLQHQ